MNWRRSWPGFFVAALVVVAATLLVAFPATFTGLSIYDDTGYMLALIRGFNAHGALYTGTFSQYGPAYSEIYALLCRVLGVPATQEGVRWITVAVWEFAALAGGLLAFRLTRNVVQAVCAQIFCFLIVFFLRGDAGHPVSLCVGCAAGGAMALPLGQRADEWTVNGSGGVPWRAFWLGAALGTLGLIKINLGVFALAALGTAWTFSTPADGLGRGLRWMVGGVLCLLPLLLVGQAWPPLPRAFFAGRALTTFLAMLVVTAREGGSLSWPTAGRLAAGMAAGWVAIWIAGIAVVCATGTPPAAVLAGVLLRPLRLATVYHVIPQTGALMLLLTTLGLSSALAWRFLPWARLPAAFTRGRMELALRVFFIGLVIFWLFAGKGFLMVMPFLWVVLLPVEQGQDLAGPFARRVLAFLAATQSLSLYPVAGIQILVPAYLGALTAVIAAVQLGQDWTTRNAGKTEGFTTKPTGLPRRAWVPAAVLVLLLGLLGVRTASAWRERSRMVPLSAPGAELVYGTEGQVAGYAFLAANLRDQRTFLTLPGMNSIYSVAGVSYPPGLNCTENFALLTPDEQRSLVEIGRRCEPVAMVYNQEIFDWWRAGGGPAAGPLVDFQRRECQLLGQAATYTLLSYLPVGSGPAPPPSLDPTACAVLATGGREAGTHSMEKVWLKAPGFQPVGAVLVSAEGKTIGAPVAVDPPSQEPPRAWPSCTFRNLGDDTYRSLLSGNVYLRLSDARGQRVTTVPFFVPAQGTD